MTYSRTAGTYISDNLSQSAYEYDVDISKIAAMEGMRPDYQCSVVNIEGTGMKDREEYGKYIHPDINPALADYAMCRLDRVCEDGDHVDRSIAVMQFVTGSVAKVANFNIDGVLDRDGGRYRLKDGLSESRTQFEYMDSAKKAIDHIRDLAREHVNYGDLSVNCCQLPPGQCHVEVCGVDQEVLQGKIEEHVARGEVVGVRVGGGARPNTSVQNPAIKTAHVSRRR